MTSDPRHERARPEQDARDGAPVAESPFRTDLERIRFAPAFSRLAEVTQVVTSAATVGVVHNRLSHTIKVTAVARAIANQVARAEPAGLLADLGGLDQVVVQAAASAHDLGHPPFGHLGERVLDRLARQRFGLHDGFEGNAQTFRIITELEVRGPGDDGLNLTAAVRAAVLKYPWGRFAVPDPHPTDWPVLPRGARIGSDGPGAGKFSAYVIDLPELLAARAAFPMLGPGQQTVECSVMDLADDIAYSLHDVEDFHRSGVLQFSPVSAEFRAWVNDRDQLDRLGDDQLDRLDRAPGAGLERLRRRLRQRDRWVFDEELFQAGVIRVGEEFVDGVLASPYDGSMAADRAISGFTGRWIDHLIGAVRLDPAPTLRAGWVNLSPEAWHQVSILKFVHQYFILDRPDLAMFQRGQAEILQRLVAALDEWLSDRLDAARAPRRLLDLVRVATGAYRRVAEEEPGWLEGSRRVSEPDGVRGRTGDAELVRMGRGRGIIDFVSGLTDEQAIAFSSRLSGGSGVLWSTGAL
ncbi:deoxyguanosinetriphosphate triphosphohydrolase family protein [Microlunatus speluncae]|uniref:deoxyguanosinetriphosphate triphosphohydrolase family protein n=1 Tax=Microlunatus speluncae TaxID=2594267 RepID=UPI0012661F20|nr:dNTP triphosphohydrolase [Microlunatus speluncae]